MTLTERLQLAADKMNQALARDALGVSVAMNHRTRMGRNFNPAFGEDFCISTLALMNVALGTEMLDRKGPHLSYIDEPNGRGTIQRFIVCTGVDCSLACPVEQLASDPLTTVG